MPPPFSPAEDSCAASFPHHHRGQGRARRSLSLALPRFPTEASGAADWLVSLSGGASNGKRKARQRGETCVKRFVRANRRSAGQNSSMHHTREVKRCRKTRHVHKDSKTDQTSIDSRRRCCRFTRRPYLSVVRQTTALRRIQIGDPSRSHYDGAAPNQAVA